jgi:riboflavin synthase
MFTGIIRHIGEVRTVERRGSAARLAIDVGPLAQGLGPGDSVAVDGACLTVASLDATMAWFDVVAETLSRTTLGALSSGSRANLERSLRMDSALDGHLVQGHVDGIASLRSVRRGGQELWDFEGPVSLTEQMVSKGSVTLAGVSLTLAEVGEGRFSVALIPTTLEETTLGTLSVGDPVNVETDLIGKYVARYLSRVGQGSGVTLDKLKEAGFA